LDAFVEVGDTDVDAVAVEVGFADVVVVVCLQEGSTIAINSNKLMVAQMRYFFILLLLLLNIYPIRGSYITIIVPQVNRADYT